MQVEKKWYITFGICIKKYLYKILFKQFLFNYLYIL